MLRELGRLATEITLHGIIRTYKHFIKKLLFRNYDRYMSILFHIFEEQWLYIRSGNNR